MCIVPIVAAVVHHHVVAGLLRNRSRICLPGRGSKAISRTTNHERLHHHRLETELSPIVALAPLFHCSERLAGSPHSEEAQPQGLVQRTCALIREAWRPRHTGQSTRAPPPGSSDQGMSGQKIVRLATAEVHQSPVDSPSRLPVRPLPTVHLLQRKNVSVGCSLR